MVFNLGAVCHFSGVARASDKSIHNLIFNLILFDFAIRHEVHSTSTHCLDNAG